MAKETLRGFPFFDIMSFDFTGDDNGAPGGGYDLAWSMLLGAQVNSPKLGSTTRFSALGPWEQSTVSHYTSKPQSSSLLCSNQQITALILVHHTIEWDLLV